MSMLAEKKQKKKRGYRLNPQDLKNEAWTEDDSKFGQKMLEKYGWSKGEGIGTNQQGMSDPIKQKVNFDGEGLGFTGPTETPSFFDAYEEALSALNEEYSDKNANEPEKPPESLEQRSKASKKRIHYHKFVRAKDVSRYTDQDLQGIFGTKKSVRMKFNANKTEKKESPSCEGENMETGVKLVKNEQNLKDYFQEKMKKLKQTRNEGILADTSVSEERPSFALPDLNFTPQRREFSFNYSSCETPVIDNTEQENEEPRKKKKKSKKSKTKEVLAVIEETEERDKVSKKLKKKLKLMSTKNLAPVESTSSPNESYLTATEISQEEKSIKKKRKRPLEPVVKSEEISELKIIKTKKVKLSTKESFRILASDVEKLCSKVRKSKSTSHFSKSDLQASGKPKKEKKKKKID